MKQIFKDYIAIREAFPNKNILTKEQKKQEHTALMNWKRSEYQETLTFEECLTFIKENPNVSLVNPFFDKLIIPHLVQSVKNKDFKAIKEMLELFPNAEFFSNERHRLHYCITKVVDVLLEDAPTYSSISILKNTLKQYPDHQPTMRRLFDELSMGFSFAVHELPIGILDFSYEEDMDDLRLLKELAERLTVQLDEKDKRHIEFLETIYPAYNDYLTNRKGYQNFEDYLNDHNIASYDENNYIL